MVKAGRLTRGIGKLLCASGHHAIRGVPGWQVCIRGCGYTPPRDVVRIVEADPGASPAGSPMTNKMPADAKEEN